MCQIGDIMKDLFVDSLICDLNDLFIESGFLRKRLYECDEKIDKKMELLQSLGLSFSEIVDKCKEASYEK